MSDSPGSSDDASSGGGRVAGNPGPIQDPLIGTLLADRYEILQRMTQGGMGVVYKARHKALGTLMAVKLLLQSEPAAQQRFLREAQLASKIQHPNTVYIADFGVLPDGRPFLAMEFIAAPTLSQALERGRMDPQRACEIALQIARGMQPIHDKGIVHREQFFPPSNPVPGFQALYLQVENPKPRSRGLFSSRSASTATLAGCQCS